ncbi:MAG: helix-turn-helix transcriptional regulator [Candidatus Limiplasma sp.]|nr:helix-turn-helix transcriptional regulator [Candidatus Limiplasma sp.]
MASKLGTLIKEARVGAGLTQEKLAKKVGGGLTAADIGKAERGEQTLAITMLKKIAKATGVTQSSLVNAAKGTSKPTTAAGATTVAHANTSMHVTSAEKQLISYYRKADSDTKKAATNVLRGKCSDQVPSLIDSDTTATGQTQGSVADMISDALGSLLGNK